jgi:hypothetical protein
MKRTKVQILQEQYAKARDEAQRIALALTRAKQTDAPSPECASCGASFNNMYDFDAHYLVDDERYLNLGNCPTRYNNGRLMPALNVWGKSLEEEAHKLNDDLNQAKEDLEAYRRDDMRH